MPVLYFGYSKNARGSDALSILSGLPLRKFCTSNALPARGETRQIWRGRAHIEG